MPPSSRSDTPSTFKVMSSVTRSLRFMRRMLLIRMQPAAAERAANTFIITDMESNMSR